jgi:hypothetical protein
MRLTVGPLPAAVYWRRRGVVLVGLGMIVLIILYVFSGPDGSANTNAAPTPSESGSTPSPSTAAATTPSSTAASPSATAFTLPVAGATGPCNDTEIEVTATAAVAEVRRGQPVAFTIKIKNISARSCVRDVGADAQELLLKDGVTIIWSSDDCGANHGQDLKQFTPGYEVSYTRTWTGYRSRGGNNTVECGAPMPDPKVYQLFARLDEKLSPPFELTIIPS